MELDINGKNAVVCASSQGLGRACAIALAQAGCNVVINGRTKNIVEETAKEINEKYKVKAVAVVGDVSSKEGQDKLLSVFEEVDILVNNNGGPPRRNYTELNRDDMIKGVEQNMITPIELIQRTAPEMAKRKFGRIVNITSLSVMMPIEGLDLSSGARAGLTAFLAGVRPIYAKDNVTINNLMPGKMDTKRLRGGFEMAAKNTGKPIAEIEKMQKEEIPAQRFGTPEEFGQTCAFLCSKYAGYMTGQNILMDGGLFPHSF